MKDISGGNGWLMKVPWGDISGGNGWLMKVPWGDIHRRYHSQDPPPRYMT